jgi:hypothetical protein
MVQGAHAVAQYCLDFPDSEWKNQTIVFVKVRNEEKLTRLQWKLEKEGKQFSKFCEPDIGNQLTAIACYDDGKIFHRLELA